MKGFPLRIGGRWVRYTPADPVVDAADVQLMQQALADIIATKQADHDRLARMVKPYVEDATVEELAAIFEADPEDFVRLHRYILTRVFYERPSS